MTQGDEATRVRLRASGEGASRELPAAIGRYRVDGIAGRGGMGVVYLGHDDVLGRAVAIKGLSDDLTGDPEAVRRLEREARALASVHHPNVAAIFGLESHEGRPHLVLEHVPGPTLAERLDGGALPIDEAIAVGAQVASGIAAAHERGVIHLDLKPANIKLGERATWKVLDFGLARSRALDAADPAADVSGTPGYMSPEQIHGRLPDVRADAWAFACVLYACLAGRPAFPGESALDRMGATLRAEPDWSALPGETPPHVVDLLRACLVKDPGERLDSLSACVTELERGASAAAADPARPGLKRSLGNLPLRVGTLIGRDREVESLGRLLATSRLVTLSGPGGIGKTRLAIEVARREQPRRAGGAWLVELASTSDPSLAMAAVAKALGVLEKHGRSLEDCVLSFVAGRSMLLVVDNCEHLLRAVTPMVERLLERAPALVVLATSRELLDLPEERPFAVGPLALPKDAADPTSAAVRLFVERAAVAAPGFVLGPEATGVVASICRRLDGIPLAIELAAARLESLSLAQVDEGVRDRFRLLAGPEGVAVRRHETLRATLDWSHDLLGPLERVLYRRLAVFAGGFTLEAAERTCGDETLDPADVVDVLARLVERSLVTATSRGRTTRYAVMETVRDHAREKLAAAGEAEIVRGRHRDAFLEFVRKASPRVVQGGHVQAWLERLEAEHDNVRAALAWCVEEDVESGLHLVGEMAAFWRLRGHLDEAIRWATAMEERGRDAPAHLRARAVATRARILALQGDMKRVQALIEEILPVVAARGPEGDVELHSLLLTLGHAKRELGDWTGARADYERCLEWCRSSGNDGMIPNVLTGLGNLAFSSGRYVDARRHAEEALPLAERAGDLLGIAGQCNNLAMACHRLGDLRAARAAFERGLAVARPAGLVHVVGLLAMNLDRLDLDDPEGDPESRHDEEAERAFRQIGNMPNVGRVVWGRGVAALRRGDVDGARGHFRESLRIHRDAEDHHSPAMGACLSMLADCAVRSGDAATAARLLGAWETLARALPESVETEGRAHHAEVGARAREALGEDAFEAACSEGQALDRPAAVELAMRSPPEA